MNYNSIGYLKEIEDVSWVQEVIMERFDNALELMTLNTIVYGGAIRDCLLGVELVGDLDLAVPKSEFKRLFSSFQHNPRWVSIQGNNIYDNQDILIQSMSLFKTIRGQIVQLISARGDFETKMEEATCLARNADIVCCGVVMFNDGRVFEVIPGAYQECIDGVLTINDNSNSIHPELLKSRIDKLVGRGWKSEIDVIKTLKRVKASRAKAMRKSRKSINHMVRKRPMFSSKKENSVTAYMFTYGNTDDHKQGGGYMKEITAHDVAKYYGDEESCINAVKYIAKVERLNVRVKITPVGNIYYETENGHISFNVENRLLKVRKSRTIVNDYSAVPQPTLTTNSSEGATHISLSKTVGLPKAEEPILTRADRIRKLSKSKTLSDLATRVFSAEAAELSEQDEDF